MLGCTGSIVSLLDSSFSLSKVTPEYYESNVLKTISSVVLLSFGLSNLLSVNGSLQWPSIYMYVQYLDKCVGTRPESAAVRVQWRWKSLRVGKTALMVWGFGLDGPQPPARGVFLSLCPGWEGLATVLPLWLNVQEGKKIAAFSHLGKANDTLHYALVPSKWRKHIR